MRNAFVFGKFYPFHLGHLALIEYAKQYCEKLSIVVCASDKEKIPAAERCQWIADTFPNDTQLLPFDYSEDKLVNSSVSDRNVSRQWSEVFKRLLPEAQLLITSEAYGEFVAQAMDIEHLAFDPPRHQVPISAEKIRSNIIAHWHWLPRSVKRYFQKKVAICGTESTGKSSLTAALAQHFDGSLVEEAGRRIIPATTLATPKLLQEVVEQHAQDIRFACEELKPLVFIDTDVYTTLSYAQHLFQIPLVLSPQVFTQNCVDLRLYLGADAPFVQDGTRTNHEERDLIDLSHRQTLINHEQKFTCIDGDWQQRQQRAIQIIDDLINNLL